jgi:hypothetical protein
MKIVSLAESWRGRALVISAVDRAESWFSEEELAVARSFRLPKRQTEWMLSRIAEKELRRQGAAGDCVSFSHSGPYGGAAVGSQPVGLDVEALRDFREAAAHLFLTDDEIEVMERCTIPDRLLHFWCAKEALWKQRGGVVPTLKRIPLRLQSLIVGGLRFEGVDTFAGEVVAALTRPTP